MNTAQTITVDRGLPVVEPLGIGLGNARLREVSSHAPLLEHAFERTGWDPDRFRGYRVKITYPVPFIFMSWWFNQPEAP